MRLVKLLGSTIFRASALLCGGLLMLTATSGSALAIDLGTGPAPEIDPSSICGAITLLVGGAMLLTSRRPRK